MPQLELSERTLTVHLSKWEQLFSFIHEVQVPLADVQIANAANGRGAYKLGWRLPGTHVPYVLAAGTFISNGARQFVYKRHGLQSLVIELTGNQWARLIIGVQDASEEASRINAAVNLLRRQTNLAQGLHRIEPVTGR